jgi:hypothetical protein
MRLMIVTNKETNNIACVKEFDDVESRGELAHFICELEKAKQELLELWEDKEG